MVALGGLGTAIYGGTDGRPGLYICGFITAVLSGVFVLVDYSDQDHPTHQTTEAGNSDHTFTPNPEFPI